VVKDTVLLRIEPKAYELNLAKADARILGLHAELEQIDQKAKNDRLSLEIEKASLDIAVRDLKRSRGLLEKGAASQAAVDADERAVLAQERIVQSLENSLNLAASIRRAKEAQLAAGHISLEQAQRDLDSTVIKATSTAVLSDVFVRDGQFVTENQPIFESYRGETMTVQCTTFLEKVENHFDHDTLERLKRELRTYGQSQNLEDVFDVRVKFNNGPESFEWQGQLKTVSEAVDNGVRTVEFRITVRNPEKAGIRERPALLKGACCTVELAGPAIKSQVFLPQRAVHNDHVYVVDDSCRLERRDIETTFYVGDLVAVKGVKAGERIVVSEITSAVEGMLVLPVPESDPYGHGGVAIDVGSDKQAPDTVAR
jgi:multidrug efflux pump subunit AcrA (membrane-fusion protein)